MKKIAILLSYYNGEKFIDEQIESLQKQTGSDFVIDIFIRDDGSTKDVSIKKLKEIESEHKEIKIIWGENLGVVGSFMSLLESVYNYDYYFFCDQDDYWLESKVKAAVCKLNNSDAPSLYCSGYTLVDSQLKYINSKSRYIYPSFENAIFKNFCTGCTSAINNKLRTELLTNYRNLNVPMHDWWFLLVAYRCGKVLYDNDSHILYRQHGNNVVGGVDTFKSKIVRFIKQIQSNNSSRSEMVKSLVENKNLPKEMLLLEDLLQSKKSLLNKFKVINKLKINYGNFLDNFSVYLIVLLGRF